MLLIRSGPDCGKQKMSLPETARESVPKYSRTLLTLTKSQLSPTFEELRGALVTHFQVAHEEVKNTECLKLTVYHE